ncbi:MAG: alpha-ribazole phosphatase family protein [Zoogloea sp.]|nr:alpha-ribazole phosphatase family protein [Zoogloea sp.]
MELYLIRHPRPDVPPGVCYGQSDVGLAECPEIIAARLRPHLPQDFALHASPLQRARRLAEALGKPVLDGRLMEMGFGEWELKPYAEIGDALDAWVDDPMGFRAPGGESALEMAARVHGFLDELLVAPCGAAVIVAHGGPLRAIAGRLLGLPPARWLGLDFACGQVSRLDVFDWGTTLRWFNR